MFVNCNPDSARCHRVCLCCGPEEGAWIVGAYTAILGIVGLALLISAEAWDHEHIFGPIGIVLFFLLFVASFLLFYGMYQKSIHMLYVWMGIFFVNFASHVVVWIITVIHWSRADPNVIHLSAPNEKKAAKDYRMFLVEVVVGSVCLLLSLWCFATMIVVIMRMHGEHHTHGHMTRPFSFRADQRPSLNGNLLATPAEELKLHPHKHVEP